MKSLFTFVVLFSVGVGMSVRVGEMSCEQQSSDGTMTCTFQIGTSAASVDPVQYKSCVGSDCVRAVAQVIVEDNDSKPEAGTKDRTPPKDDRHADKPVTVSQDGTILIRKAAYRQPYSQYGPQVASVLAQHIPPPRAHVIDWANFLLELGTAHFTNIDGKELVEWSEVELAINAFRQCIDVIVSQTNTRDDVPEFEREGFVASVQSHLAEAYGLDPHRQHIPEALENYRLAKDRYKQLIDKHFLGTLQVPFVEDMEQRYAEICTKLAMALISTTDPISQQPEWAANLVQVMQQEQNQQQDDFGSHDSQNTAATFGEANTYDPESDRKTVEEADNLLTESIRIYDKYLHSSNYHWNQELAVSLLFGKALALQYGASSAIILGDVKRARSYLEQAISIYRDQILPNPQLPPHDVANTRASVADLQLSLADVALQMGDYETAKGTYALAMDWHVKHQVDVAPIHDFDDDDDTLTEYWKALQEYKQGIQQGLAGAAPRKIVPQGNADTGEQMYFQRDDGYEGDLRASLGALYISRGENELAISQLAQAIQLYNAKGEGRARPTAEAKINLAMALYRDRQFEESKTTQLEAYDLLRELYGTGVNPYTQGLDEYEELLARAAGREGLVSGKENVHSGDKTSPINPVIDLEQYKESIKNSTEAIPKPSNTDEL